MFVYVRRGLAGVGTGNCSISCYPGVMKPLGGLLLLLFCLPQMRQWGLETEPGSPGVPERQAGAGGGGVVWGAVHRGQPVFHP